MWRSEGNGWTGSRAVRLHGVLQSWKKRLVGGVFSGCFVYGRGWDWRRSMADEPNVYWLKDEVWGKFLY